MTTPELVQAQRTYFETGATRSADFRLAALKKLQAAVQANERVLAEAMAADFRKAPMEVYMTETGMVLDEIRFHLKHLRAWMRETRVPTPLAQFPSRSFRSPEPYGVCLILSPAATRSARSRTRAPDFYLLPLCRRPFLIPYNLRYRRPMPRSSRRPLPTAH